MGLELGVGLACLKEATVSGTIPPLACLGLGLGL